MSTDHPSPPGAVGDAHTGADAVATPSPAADAYAGADPGQEPEAVDSGRWVAGPVEAPGTVRDTHTGADPVEAPDTIEDARWESGPVEAPAVPRRSRSRGREDVGDVRPQTSTRLAPRPTGTERFLVLGAGSGEDDIVALDLATDVMVRLHGGLPPLPDGTIQPFDVVDGAPSAAGALDDPARPEAILLTGPLTRAGIARGRQVHRLLQRVVAPPEPHLLGFPGSSWPYWEFRGGHPSVAVVVPSRGPMLFQRSEDSTAWVRFGWYRTDNWLPVQDPAAQAALASGRRRRLTGKHLTAALGFRPAYLVVAVSRPRDGYCSKSVVAMLPRS